jgi:hypothetical protein
MLSCSLSLSLSFDILLKHFLLLSLSLVLLLLHHLMEEKALVKFNLSFSLSLSTFTCKSATHELAIALMKREEKKTLRLRAACSFECERKRVKANKIIQTIPRET